MSIVKSAMRGTPLTLQDAVTTGNGTVIAIPNSFHEHLFTIVGSAGVSAGKIKVEDSNNPDYTGTWALQGTEQTILDNGQSTVAITGVLQFVRARVSVNVVGGTVSVIYEGS